jgi:hypothetical protein
MIKKLMQRLGRHRVIMDRQSNEPYLERYYVFLKDRTWFPFNIFVHKFLKSDPDHLHDHPWSYFTLILKGGYYEWVPYYDKDNNKMTEICKWRGPGHFRVCKATSYHRIDLNPDITAWTLFIPGPQKREWGFMVRNKWIHNNDYLSKMAKQK